MGPCPTWWPPSEYRWHALLKMTRNESSVIPFLVPCCSKVCLKTTAWVPCSNTPKTEERKTWTQSELCTWQNSIRGQETPKMYIGHQPRRRPNIVQSLADFCWAMSHSNKAKIQNLLKFAGVSETHQAISAPSGRKFTILSVTCVGDV